MKIIYECEKLAVLQDGDKYIIHILDNYRMVKEINTNSRNIFTILNEEFHFLKFIKRRKIKQMCKIDNLTNLLKAIWSEEEKENYLLKKEEGKNYEK